MWQPQRSAAGLGLLLCLSACDIFVPRTPEEPGGAGGTFIQPDAPDIVITNLRAAVAELNASSYRRSLHASLEFTPTAIAEARDPSLWASWGHAEENSYFTTLTEAARQGTGHLLRLDDVTSEIGDRHYKMDANYLLVIRHQRFGVPDTLQGRLIWEIASDENGMWTLRRWTDQELSGAASWSDLKAEFAN